MRPSLSPTRVHKLAMLAVVLEADDVAPDDDTVVSHSADAGRVRHVERVRPEYKMLVD